jgi:hypothetical protein
MLLEPTWPIPSQAGKHKSSHVTQTSSSEACNLGELTERDKVFALEDMMREQTPLELKTEHFFSPGIYTRILHIPKGCLLTGKIHKEPILNIMIKGDISVLLGDEVKRIIAPFVIVSPAGSKKIGYAHEDTIWIGCHGTDEVDVCKIEDRFIAQDEKEWLEHIGQARIGTT